MEYIDGGRRRKIQDFFPDERKKEIKEERRKHRVSDERRKRHKIDTYLDDADWQALKSYCDEADEKPSIIIRRLIRKFLKEQKGEAY